MFSINPEKDFNISRNYSIFPFTSVPLRSCLKIIRKYFHHCKTIFLEPIFGIFSTRKIVLKQIQNKI